MRRAVIAANWKMHGSKRWIEEWLAAWSAEFEAAVEVVILPPVGYLWLLSGLVEGRKEFGSIRLGAQNVHAEVRGAFTGESAAEMFHDLGAAVALVGHSERRQQFGETDAVVAAKFAAAQRAGLMPVLCVGESLVDRQRGMAGAVVLRQLEAVIAAVGIGALEQAMVAYEPVWAIGTGETATPADAQNMHALIRARIAREAPDIAEELTLLYGGSVKSTSAAALFAEPDVDGALVGGASLDPREFARICNAA